MTRRLRFDRADSPVTDPSRCGCDTDRPCALCGEPFHPRRADARYCSGRCRTRAHRGQDAEPDAVMCSRPDCFVWFAPARSDQRYCSTACRQADYRERVSDRLADAEWSAFCASGGAAALADAYCAGEVHA